MASLPDSARAVLQSDALAHMVTLDPDGGPQISCVWVGLEGDEIVFASLGPRRKLDNIARDPRVSMSIMGDGHNAIGLREYLVVHGRARIVQGGGPELLTRLAAVYMPGVPFPPMPDPPPGVVVRITVDRLGGVGPWA